MYICLTVSSHLPDSFMSLSHGVHLLDSFMSLSHGVHLLANRRLTALFNGVNQNYLKLNVCKTKEMLIDFRRNKNVSDFVVIKELRSSEWRHTSI